MIYVYILIQNEKKATCILLEMSLNDNPKFERYLQSYRNAPEIESRQKLIGEKVSLSVMNGTPVLYAISKVRFEMMVIHPTSIEYA